MIEQNKEVENEVTDTGLAGLVELGILEVATQAEALASVDTDRKVTLASTLASFLK